MSQLSAFGNFPILTLPDADITYTPGVFQSEECIRLIKTLISKVVWKNESIKIFGKTLLQPRLTAFYGDKNKPYTYSHLTLQPRPWIDELNFIRERAENLSNYKYSSVLLNYYRDGKDSMGWHSDGEKSLETNPVITSVSFGAKRKFMLKHKTDKSLKHDLQLENGSILIMKGVTQRHWLHQLPKTQKQIGPRINLTFRRLS